MADLNDSNDLFDGGLDSKMDFLEDQKSVSNDGIYRVDLAKAHDKKKGWKSTIRFLPNLMRDGKVGQSALSKITHYVDIKNPRELAGWFDSPKNFGEKCPLTDLYYTMQNSKNAILMEKSKQLKYSKKYYSYILVIEDEQQPDLVGKIMIFQYGKTIKDKIQAEKVGAVDPACNVFDLSAGKDFVLVVKEIQTRNANGDDETYPDYKMSSFKREESSLPIYFKEKGIFKNVPTDADGKIKVEAQNKIREFLLDREYDLEAFSARPLTDEQHAKISEITAHLTGKASSSYSNKESSKPVSEDFEFEDNFTAPKKETPATDEDDFFDTM